MESYLKNLSSRSHAILISNMVREERILHSIIIAKGQGLELGPLTSPIVKKNEGDIFYADHMSRDELKEKYKSEPVELDKIVPVDFILKDKSLTEAVAGKKFDYVLASHVIEHIPDTVRWLKDVAHVLKPGGILSLVIPDKRFTFDVNRQVTRPSELIGAYLDGLKKPSSAMMYDFAVNYTPNVDTASAWMDSEKYTGNRAKRRWSLQEAYGMCLQNLDPKQYVDSHCLVFTPYSFMDILREIIINDLMDYEVAFFLETQQNELEFYVSLRKIKSSKNKINIQLASLPATRKVMSQEKQLKKRLAKLEQDITILQGSIESIRESASWRITYPLRYVMSVIKRLK